MNSSLIGSLLLTFGPHVGKRRETKEEERIEVGLEGQSNHFLIFKTNICQHHQPAPHTPPFSLGMNLLKSYSQSVSRA